MDAKEYEAPTQTKSSPPCRSLGIVGSAVEMAVRSSALTNVQTIMARKESQNADPFFVLLGGGASGSGEGGAEDTAAVSLISECG